MQSLIDFPNYSEYNKLNNVLNNVLDNDLNSVQKKEHDYEKIRRGQGKDH